MHGRHGYELVYNIDSESTVCSTRHTVCHLRIDNTAMTHMECEQLTCPSASSVQPYTIHAGFAQATDAAMVSASLPYQLHTQVSELHLRFAEAYYTDEVIVYVTRPHQLCSVVKLMYIQ